jgi:hypothetical protein
MVERGAQVVNDIPHHGSPADGERRQFENRDYGLRAVAIDLGPQRNQLFLRCDFPLKRVKVLFGSVDLRPTPIEGVGHGA